MDCSETDGKLPRLASDTIEHHGNIPRGRFWRQNETGVSLRKRGKWGACNGNQNRDALGTDRFHGVRSCRCPGCRATIRVRSLQSISKKDFRSARLAPASILCFDQSRPLTQRKTAGSSNLKNRPRCFARNKGPACGSFRRRGLLVVTTFRSTRRATGLGVGSNQQRVLGRLVLATFASATVARTLVPGAASATFVARSASAAGGDGDQVFHVGLADRFAGLASRTRATFTTALVAAATIATFVANAASATRLRRGRTFAGCTTRGRGHRRNADESDVSGRIVRLASRTRATFTAAIIALATTAAFFTNAASTIFRRRECTIVFAASDRRTTSAGRTIVVEGDRFGRHRGRRSRFLDGIFVGRCRTDSEKGQGHVGQCKSSKSHRKYPQKRLSI